MQIAKHLGAYVIGTSSLANKDFVESLGVDQYIDYRSQQFEEVVKDIDFVLETIGGDNFVRSLDVLKPTGTIINLPSGLTEEVKRVAEEKGVTICFFMMVEPFNTSNGKATSPDTTSDENKFFIHFNEFTKECGSQNDWTLSTYEKFSSIKNHLVRFDKNLSYDTLHESNLTDYVNYLREQKNMRNSTITKHLSFLMQEDELSSATL